MVNKTDETTCPLCGNKNYCLNVQGGGPKNNCWCNSDKIRFPPGLIDQVPAPLKRKACICQSCAKSQSVLPIYSSVKTPDKTDEYTFS